MKFRFAFFILLFGFLLLLPLVFYSTGFACTCTNKNDNKRHSEALKDVKAIFYGEAVSKGEEKTILKKYKDGVAIPFSFQPVRFKVLRYWKGIETEEVIIETEIGSSCGFNPEVGKSYMIYAYENSVVNALSANYCSVSGFYDDKMKREYGEGKSFPEATPQASPSIEQKNVSENFFLWLWKQILSFFA